MLTNLATLSFYQGRYSEAEAEYRRALDIQERDGLDTASTLSNLAVLYRRQARYQDAERLYVRALSMPEKALGPQHPEIAGTLPNLANIHTPPPTYPKPQRPPPPPI